MRWENLFDDLETQLEHELSAEELDFEAEEERLRLGRLAVRDRLVALCGPRSTAGQRLVVNLVGGERLVMHPVAFGRDWFSADVVAEGSRLRQCIVPLDALVWVGLEPAAVPLSLGVAAEPALSDRLGIAFVLRDLCRRRRPIDVVLTTGEMHGTVDRVGRDHLDLAVHDRDVPRRDAAVREVRVVPFSALAFVRL